MEQNRINIPRYKIVFIGDQAVGKTSIMIRFAYDDFSLTQQPTIGLDFISKIIKINDREIRLQLWDTAGQERFRSLIPSYIRDTKVAIVCYDVTVQESFDSVVKWLEFIREGEKEILTILIANKIDLVEERVVTTEQGQAFATQQELRYFEVSAKEGTNVSQMFKNISYQILYPSNIGDDSQIKSQELIDQNSKNHNLSQKVVAQRKDDEQKCMC